MSDRTEAAGDDLDLTAAEYVIGTLDAAERAAFAERLRRDAGAYAAFAAWEARLLGLGDYLPAVAPPSDLWARIDQAIEAASGAQRFRVIDGGGIAAPRADFKASRDRWRTGALLSGSIAAALMIFVAAQQLRGVAPTAPDATYVAAVNRGGDKPALLVRVDMKTRRIFVRPIAAEAPSGRSLELWYIGDGKPPRSMGLVEKASETLTVPEGASGHDATFAVSVEPPGGSKAAGPSGPVVYSGQLVAE